jgi:hypothetical protein
MGCAGAVCPRKKPQTQQPRKKADKDMLAMKTANLIVNIIYRQSKRFLDIVEKTEIHKVTNLDEFILAIWKAMEVVPNVRNNIIGLIKDTVFSIETEREMVQKVLRGLYASQEVKSKEVFDLLLNIGVMEAGGAADKIKKKAAAVAQKAIFGEEFIKSAVEIMQGILMIPTDMLFSIGRLIDSLGNLYSVLKRAEEERECNNLTQPGPCKEEFQRVSKSIFDFLNSYYSMDMTQDLGKIWSQFKESKRIPFEEKVDGVVLNIIARKIEQIQDRMGPNEGIMMEFAEQGLGGVQNLLNKLQVQR